MNDSIACPQCQKQYKFKPGMAGKRVKCLKCQYTFTVAAPEPEAGFELVAEEDNVRPVPPPIPLAPPSLPRPGLAYATPVGATPYAPGEWTPGQKQQRKLGLQLGIFGLVSVVLPFFGLQFSLLNLLGPFAILGGLLVLLVGIFLFVYPYLARTRFFGGPNAFWKITGTAAGAVTLCFVALLAVVFVVALGRAGTAGAAVAANGPAAVTAPPAARTPSAKPTPAPSGAVWPTDTGNWPPMPGNGNLPGPGGPRPPNRPADSAPSAIIEVSGVDRLPGDAAARNARINSALMAAAKTTGANNFSTSFLKDRAVMKVSPVPDVANLAEAIDFGTIKVNADLRLIFLDLDVAKVPAYMPPPPNGGPKTDMTTGRPRSVAERFPAEQIVRIRLMNTKDLNSEARTTLQRRLLPSIIASLRTAGTRATSFVVEDDVVVAMVAPSTDPQRVADAIKFGKVLSIDKTRQIVDIDLNDVDGAARK